MLVGHRESPGDAVTSRAHALHADIREASMNIGSPVLGTDFALDALGRYVCNTVDEALANSDPVYRAAAQLPPRGDMRPFDFLVIGGGTFGAAVAEQLWFRSTG